MKETLEAAQVAVTLADFVNIDGDGRATLVGAGNRVLLVERSSWHSPPFGVWATIAVAEDPPLHAIVEVVLAGRDGESVRIPDGVGGSREIRLTQPVLFRPHATPGVDVPTGGLPATYEIAATFSSGLILEPDKAYRWQIELDGTVAAAYSFFVARAENTETE